MAPEILAFIAALAIATAWATAVAVARGNSLARIREALGVERKAEAEGAIRQAIDTARTDVWRAEERTTDLLVLAEQLDVGIVLLDRQLIVRVANLAAHRLLSRRPGTLPDLSVMEAFADHRIEAIVLAARENGAAGGELTLRERSAATVRLRARRSAVEGVWLVLEDVSELRRLQRIRTEFIDSLSHELRTPLTTVSLLAEALARESADQVPPRVKERIAKIEIETGHLVQMVSELLDLSRIERGGEPERFEDVDLGRIAAATVERLRSFAERQHVALQVHVTNGLPPVRGDEGRLGQVVVNLLHNAVKFSPAGATVGVRVEPHDGAVVVAVVDQGMGIPRAEQDRIFERFYKVDKARFRGSGGMGLGLAIARHIVNAHGGRIWVESEEGRGSTFRFSLPVAAEEGVNGRPGDGGPRPGP